ncbi:16S rRNA (guanine(527)-N(7))-methyltransferase RsmG [Pedobacter sp. SYP-B3415]|uniref:16S rRNA (guanine(527)-N(7))-methyltransferase RsmG n=1 Tax=Pedobacter sp. SYP-B3415 TaxID=2496641 RepID=UPI00101B6ED5|nr:16S rRNA (guanine(527)-N(7))-methyltransferase RsmG [Pedobacter sp. SYP-B3415]
MEITSAIIQKYFPDLSSQQIDQFERLYELYSFWNAQINVVSRKDIDLLYERHVLHSLGIAKVCRFTAGETVLDVGTGGGFPGIPLAILFPETSFHLVDSIGKKIKVVNEVSSALGLTNLRADHLRAEQLKESYNFIVSRAVTRLSEFYPWIKGKIKKQNINALQNGILYLKGGDLEEEIAESGLPAQLFSLADFFEEPFFETKYVVYIPQ